MTDFKVVIPARYASTRLPGKPILPIAGKPMIQHVYEKAVASGADQVIIATDDERISEACEAFSAQVCMTHQEHASGTDRIAEVVNKMKWLDETIVVNVQGDEPLLPENLISQLASDLSEQSDCVMSTLATPIQTARELHDPNVVKLVMDRSGKALYFSRATIPWDRDAFNLDNQCLPESSGYYRHIGLYAYRAGFIQHYNEMQPCAVEQTESLEQLRVLWNGHQIHVSLTMTPPGHGVDTQQDLARLNRILSAQEIER